MRAEKPSLNLVPANKLNNSCKCYIIEEIMTLMMKIIKIMQEINLTK